MSQVWNLRILYMERQAQDRIPREVQRRHSNPDSAAVRCHVSPHRVARRSACLIAAVKEKIYLLKTKINP